MDENVKDKVFFDAVPWKSEDHLSALGRRNERFVSFDLNLATPYDTPKYWVIHFQAWQCCSGHPPFVISVIPNESDEHKITLELAVRNDDFERVQYGQQIQIAKFSMARNEWFHVALDSKPSPIGGPTGRIEAWINGKQIVAWQGHWGYLPAAISDATHGEIKPDIGLDLGILPSSPTRHTDGSDRQYQIRDDD